MKLKEYLDNNGLTAERFVVESFSKLHIYLAISTIYAHIRLNSVPNKNHAELIEEATHGQVTVKELRGYDHRTPRVKRAYKSRGPKAIQPEECSESLMHELEELAFGLSKRKNEIHDS